MDFQCKNNRILVVDDNSMIHRDFQKILNPKKEQCGQDEIDDLAQDLFGEDQASASKKILVDYDLVFAHQGQEALLKLTEAKKNKQPFSLAFVDVRMPPGWDGIKTIEELWKVDPELLVVICTAFSDHSWEDILAKFGNSHKLMILKKPFDNIEVLQLASSLTQKWLLGQKVKQSMENLENLVKERTEELAQKSTKLSAILENSPDYVAVIDKDLIISFTNRTDPQYEKGQVVGQPVLNFYSSEERIKVRAIFSEVLKTGQSKTFESKIIYPDKSTHWFSNRLVLLKKPDEEGPSYLIVSTEITEKRSLEEQFRQSQKMEAVGRLAGGIAHDFNNLLTIHLACSEQALADENLGQETKDAITQMRFASERAAALTGQLLSFSRQQAISPTIMDANKAIVDFKPMLERIIGETISLDFKACSELYPAFIDKNQFEQVILNLIVNARDAMPDGGKIVIETDNIRALSSAHLPMQNDDPLKNEEDLGQDYVMIAVSDTGTGMPSEVKQRIFEPFFSTKELGKGTGLGLSTVFGVVKQNQGHIYVYSELGMGTAFKIYFPRYHQPIKEQVINAECKKGRASNGESVLLVEDEADLRLIVQATLKKAGFKVQSACHGAEALEVFKACPDAFDIVLSDVIMPKMSGKEMITKMREINPQVPVLFMSGYTQQSINQNGSIDEGYSFIQKPFMPKVLLGKLNDVLDGLDANS